MENILGLPRRGMTVDEPIGNDENDGEVVLSLRASLQSSSSLLSSIHRCNHVQKNMKLTGLFSFLHNVLHFWVFIIQFTKFQSDI